MACRAVVVAPYEAAVRLTAIAADNWESIDGEVSYRGGPSLLELPPERFYNAIFVWCLKHTKDPERFVIKLNTPRAGRIHRVTDDDVEREREQFAAFASAVGAHQATTKSTAG